MRVSELIETLKQVQKECKNHYGLKDPFVAMSSDAEGNSFGTIGPDSFSVDKATRTLAIFPQEERLELEEITL